MTEHTHTTLVEGCYRCDLNKDEIAAQIAEQDAVLAAVMRRILVETDVSLIRPLRRQINGTDDPLIIDFEHCGAMELDDEEFDVLSDVQDFEELADITGD